MIWYTLDFLWHRFFQWAIPVAILILLGWLVLAEKREEKSPKDEGEQRLRTAFHKNFTASARFAHKSLIP